MKGKCKLLIASKRRRNEQPRFYLFSGVPAEQAIKGLKELSNLKYGIK